MSSEDDDEELLQRALAQQQQRDHSASVSALSSAPRRPPPPQRDLTPPASALSSAPRRPPPPVRSAPPTRAPPIILPMEEEEESEVELLSISSDDDSPAPANRRASGEQKAAASKARDGPAAQDDSDLEWDDDQEPEKWTSVDQTELVRRVWEMRETRAVNPTTIMRRSTTIVDHGARGEELLDPLGLGVINMKTLTLVRKDQKDSVNHTGKGGSANEKDARSEEPQGDSPSVRDPATKEKIMYHSENFDPKLFLARVHRNTGASDLEAGEGALKMDLQNRKSQLKKLVKENFDCFISCKNTIDDIHSKLQQIEADPEGAGTVHLSNSIQSVDASAKRAFGPLLERQAQAERIRSVQGMLQRFRTLFNLPSIIRGHISKGEYDMAIREYKKAKSLVQYTHVGILSRVLEEVDKIVQEFKDMLYKTMENPNVDTSQLENTIRLLLELEPDSDPVWYYLSVQDRRIRGLLEGCSLEHEARMDALHARVQEKVQSDARWKQLQRESNKGSDVDFHLLLGDQDKDTGEVGQLKQSIGEESDALLGRLIRRLTVVLVQHVPNLWRLALLIFSGKFVKVSQAGSANGHRKSLSNEASVYPFENHSPGLKYTRHSMDEVLTMVHCIISLYETKVQNAFIALAEANVFRPYMREALTEIASACVALQGKDCAPTSAVQSLLVLRSEVTRVFVLRLCTLVRGATSELIHKENWVPVSTTERGDTPYAISHLPLRFRNMLEGTMEHMAEMIQKLTSESAELPEDLTYQVHQMQDNVRSTFVECFLEFAECLDKLAAPSAEATDQYQRLLVVLSNTAFCKNSLLPSLSQKYQSIWTYSQKPAKVDTDLEDDHISTTEEAFDAFMSLEEKILSQYNRTKAVEVGIAAAAYLLDDGTQWGQTPAIKGIRDNVVELMHPLVAVHAEVHAGAKPFLDKVISSLVECLITALLNVFTENKHKLLRILDVNGYCQLTLEMDFVDAVLERYFTVAAREAALGLRDMLLDKVCESVREIHLVENVGSMSMRSRAGDHAMMSDGVSPVSPDEIQARANQVSADFLPAELRRARMNVVCFMESLSETNLAGRRLPNLPKTGLGRHSSLTSLNRHLRKSSGSVLGSTGSVLGSTGSLVG